MYLLIINKDRLAVLRVRENKIQAAPLNKCICRTAPLNQRPPALLASASSAGGTMAIDTAGKCSKWDILGKPRHA